MALAETGPVILDCTVRDGNYSVDFKFTEADTGLLTSQLSALGCRWIEVGHGLGLGAMAAGKGDMPADDWTMIRAAKAVAGEARVGMFFIPGLGTMDHLERAREAGLDFVRIGENAPDLERAIPYLRRARELGLTPCVNAMKTYALTPAAFADKARGAVDAGAEVVYCVDSAGGMMPDDVARYVAAVRDAVGCEIGFHGHNNLMMVIANCLAAYREGCRFLDATLCGLGRSAGNAPTEILVAVLERLGIPTGIDLFALLDMIEQYMWPLVGQSRPHDMLGVVAGYARFHSSFLPKVAKAAQRHQVDLRRLVAKVALHDPVNLDEVFLEDAATALAGTDQPAPSHALIAFHAPGLKRSRISTSMSAVQVLLDGLVVASAKRTGARPVLHLVPSHEPLAGLVLPEFVLDDDHMSLGRVTYGSMEALEQIVTMAKGRMWRLLVSQSTGWATSAPQRVAEWAGPAATVPIQDLPLRAQYLGEVLDRAALTAGNRLLIYGSSALVGQALAGGHAFRRISIFGAETGDDAGIPGAERLAGWEAASEPADLLVCVAPPSPEDAEAMTTRLSPQGRILSLLSVPSPLLHDVAGDRVAQVDLNWAYSGIVARSVATERAFGPSWAESI